MLYDLKVFSEHNEFNEKSDLKVLNELLVLLDLNENKVLLELMEITELTVYSELDLLVVTYKMVFFTYISLEHTVLEYGLVKFLS